MSGKKLNRKIQVFENSSLTEEQYRDFLFKAFGLISQHSIYLAETEDVNCMELAHLIPEVPETVLGIYLGINDAVCNKGLVCPFLVRHGHNNVFIFDSQVYSGGDNVPAGTIDAK